MSWQKPRPKPQNLQQVSSKNRQRRHNSSSSTSSSIMNASSKGATALDGAELTAKSLNYTASRKLFCVKTGEEIPRGTYQRRGHFITCCGGNCKQPEVTNDGCVDARCNCATRQNRRTAKKAHPRSTTRTDITSFRSQIRTFTIRMMKVLQVVIMDQPAAIQKKMTTKRSSKKMRDLRQTPRRRRT